MRSLKVYGDGTTVNASLSRRDIIEAFGVHTRDLRPVFSRKQVITLTRRSRSLILNLKYAKLIIGREVALVFGLDHKAVEEEFVPMLLDRLKIERESEEGGEQLFEHTILDATLTYVIYQLRDRYNDLERLAEAALAKLEGELVDANFEQLLLVKKRLSNIETYAEELEGTLLDILKDDAEIADLTLDKINPDAHTEAEDSVLEALESVLENALEQVENISHQIDELDENIDDTQEILTLKMANLRNAIIRFDLVVSVLTAVLGVLAVIVGLYGVNLRNHLEGSPYAFWILTGILLGLGAMVSGALWSYMRRKGLL